MQRIQQRPRWRWRNRAYKARWGFAGARRPAALAVVGICDPDSRLMEGPCRPPRQSSRAPPLSPKPRSNVGESAPRPRERRASAGRLVLPRSYYSCTARGLSYHGLSYHGAPPIPYYYTDPKTRQENAVRAYPFSISVCGMLSSTLYPRAVSTVPLPRAAACSRAVGADPNTVDAIRTRLYTARHASTASTSLELCTTCSKQHGPARSLRVCIDEHAAPVDSWVACDNLSCLLPSP